MSSKRLVKRKLMLVMMTRMKKIRIVIADPSPNWFPRPDETAETSLVNAGVGQHRHDAVGTDRPQQKEALVVVDDELT